MRTHSGVLVLACFLWGSVVAPAATGASRFFAEERTYQHALFASIEDCRRAQKNFPVNCFQNISFSPDGNATVMVTDIMNLGTYVIQGSKVSYQAGPGGEVDKLAFTLSSDQKTLTLDSNGSVWSLVVVPPPQA